MSEKYHILVDYAEALKRESAAQLANVTRLEVIDHGRNLPSGGLSGRIFVAWAEKLEVELSLQDDGRTLKVFLTDKP